MKGFGMSGGDVARVVLAACLCVSGSNAAAAKPGYFAHKPKISRSLSDSIGSFTPAAADARLAAVLSRVGMTSSGFRFTPASTVRLNRSVTVAVRARSTRAAVADAQVALAAPTTAALTPVAYNLGIAVGWRKFALLGDVEKLDLAGNGRRDAVDVGLSFTGKRFSTRLQLGADRTTGALPPMLNMGAGYTADLGTSYSLTHNFDVTAGLRYRAQRDRLVSQTDTRQDSQAVYIGTAFRF